MRKVCLFVKEKRKSSFVYLVCVASVAVGVAVSVTAGCSLLNRRVERTSQWSLSHRHTHRPLLHLHRTRIHDARWLGKRVVTATPQEHHFVTQLPHALLLRREVPPQSEDHRHDQQSPDEHRAPPRRRHDHRVQHEGVQHRQPTPVGAGEENGQEAHVPRRHLCSATCSRKPWLRVGWVDQLIGHTQLLRRRRLLRRRLHRLLVGQRGECAIVRLVRRGGEIHGMAHFHHCYRRCCPGRKTCLAFL